MLLAARFFSITIALVGVSQHANSQQTPAPLTPDLNALTQKVITAYEAWGTALSTPNMSLEIKQDWIRSSSPPDNFIVLHLFGKGLPAGIYDVVEWPVTQKDPSTLMRGVTLDATGLAICAGSAGTCGSPDEPNDTIDLRFSPAPGEPVRLGLVSSDGETRVLAKVTPKPLRGEDRARPPSRYLGAGEMSFKAT